MWSSACLGKVYKYLYFLGYAKCSNSFTVVYVKFDTNRLKRKAAIAYFCPRWLSKKVLSSIVIEPEKGSVKLISMDRRKRSSVHRLTKRMKR